MGQTAQQVNRPIERWLKEHKCSAEFDRTSELPPRFRVAIDGRFASAQLR